MPVRPKIVPIAVHQGHPEDRSPYVGTFQGKGLLRDIMVSVLLEPTTPEGEQACRWAQGSLERYLAQSRGSLTGALTSALQRCHLELREANQPRRPEERVGLSIACAVTRGAEVYLARVGSHLVYKADSQGLRLLPLQESKGSRYLGLGEDALELPLQRHILKEGEAFLLVTASLKRLVTEQGLRVVMASPAKEAARKLTLLAENERAFSALLLALPQGG